MVKTPFRGSMFAVFHIGKPDLRPCFNITTLLSKLVIIVELSLDSTFFR